MAPGDPRPVLVYFASATSGPARRVESYIDQVLQARRNHETFRREVVDVDRRPDLARNFRIEHVPTILVLLDGRVVRRMEGRVGVRQLRAELEEWLR